MIVKYKASKVQMELILGILWLIMTIANWFVNNSLLLSVIFSLTTILYLGQYFHNKKHQYLSIENNIVTRHLFPKKRFDLNHLIRINRNRNGIKLISESQDDLKITTSIIDEESLKYLNSFLEKIESEIKN